jgi:predicted FMN-binding regulatory protein PaiB
MDHHHAHGAATGVHNMAVVGRRRIFLSHQPMLMAPHDSQVILEAHFAKQGKNVDDVYFADRAANPAVRFYTRSPEPFVLQELFQSDSTHPPRTR